MILLSDWKDLAAEEIAYQHCSNAAIIYATIEAETHGHNTWGDNHNSFGYGQVQPRWHYDSYLYAGQRLGISVPPQNNLSAIESLTLGNDRFSMIVAVYTINKIWLGSGKDFYKFAHNYVGDKIPDRDYNNRLKIYLSYDNTTFDAPYGPSKTSNNTENNDNNSSIFNDTVNVGTTNYTIKKNTLITGDSLYGRKYRVTVSTQNGNTLDVSDLKCTFNIHKTFQIQPNYSEVCIYNLNANTENTIIEEGNRITIEAGYEGTQYGLIYDGQIIAPFRGKEDGVTYKLTLIALDGDYFLNYALVGFTFHRGQTQRDVVKQIASTATYPIELGTIDESLSQTKLIRGKTVFGKASNYARQIAQGMNATAHVNNGKLNIEKVTALPQGEIIEISPESGLINSPMQQDYGMTCQVMLNPRIDINTLVHLDNKLITAMQQVQGQIYRELDKEGIYRVIELYHVGDNRGDDWYTEIQTITQSGLAPAMILNAPQNPY